MNMLVEKFALLRLRVHSSLQSFLLRFNHRRAVELQSFELGHSMSPPHSRLLRGDLRQFLTDLIRGIAALFLDADVSTRFGSFIDDRCSQREVRLATTDFNATSRCITVFINRWQIYLRSFHHCSYAHIWSRNAALIRLVLLGKPIASLLVLIRMMRGHLKCVVRVVYLENLTANLHYSRAFVLALPIYVLECSEA